MFRPSVLLLVTIVGLSMCVAGLERETKQDSSNGSDTKKTVPPYHDELPNRTMSCKSGLSGGCEADLPLRLRTDTMQVIWSLMYGDGGRIRLGIVKFLLTAFLPMGVYWGLGFAFYQLDQTGYPAFLAKYKTQPGKVMSWEEVRKAAIKVAFGQFIILASVSAVLSPIVARSVTVREEVPSLLELIQFLSVAYVVHSVYFYYAHRLFHWPPLYKRFHKVHHEWKAPTAIVAAYAHPLEQIFVNYLPGLLGPIIMKPHVLCMTVWMVYGMTATTVSHSGYSFPEPFNFNAYYHDYHHKQFNNNYGQWWMDWLHGTLVIPDEPPGVKVKGNKKQ